MLPLSLSVLQRTYWLMWVSFGVVYGLCFRNLAATITPTSWNQETNAEIYLGILTVSFAAQIGTMPLSICLHQFQVYFHLNLCSHPLLKFIMTLGLGYGDQRTL
jgi:competence protein ComEC